MSGPEKLDGVVYTPPAIVSLILDRCQFKGRRATEGRLIDPSCGAGAFLLPAAERLITAARKAGWDQAEIAAALQTNIVGADIDRQALQLCRSELQQLAAKYRLPEVNWQLHHGDSLRRNSAWNKSHRGVFSLVVGNPPYVRIQNLGARRRQELQRQWPTCQRGAADLFLAFFELGLQLLAPDGYLGYITPRSYFDSQAGQTLRELLLGNNYLRQIIDFDHQQVFSQVSTYTAITVAQKQQASKRRKITVERRGKSINNWQWKEQVSVDDLSPAGQGWLLHNSAERKFITSCQQRGPTLGQLTKIRVGLATLADSVYILHLAEQQPSQKLLTVIDAQGQSHDIERQLLVPIAKASTLQNDDQQQGLVIIFPYHRRSGALSKPFTDDYFKKNFPRGYQYLSTHRQRLAARGHPTEQWFEYGSTQGVQTCFGPKILVPPLSKDGQMFLRKNGEETYFSGYGIFFDADLDALFQRLQQADFRRYLRLVGRKYRGQYFALNKQIIQGFALPEQQWRDLGVSDQQLQSC